MEEKIKVVVEELDGKWHLYDESSHAVESDFDTEAEANQFAEDNDYEIVQYFN